MEIKDKLIKLLDDKQVEDIVVLDFRNKSPFLDYFIIGSVRNARMASSTIDYIDDFCAKENIKVNSIDSSKDSTWHLIDIDSIVVHIFFDETRKKYDLEGLWKDLILK